jgi:hypothetical protein
MTFSKVKVATTESKRLRETMKQKKKKKRKEKKVVISTLLVKTSNCLLKQHLDDVSRDVFIKYN